MKKSKHQYKYSLHRIQRAREYLVNEKFVHEILKGGTGNIFDEIKKLRGNIRMSSSTIDGEVGSINIANHFADQYKRLFNQKGRMTN